MGDAHFGGYEEERYVSRYACVMYTIIHFCGAVESSFELDKAHSASLRILHVNPDCDKGNRLSLHAYLPRSISPENPTSHPFASGLSFSPTGGTRRRLNNINLNVRLAIDPNVMDLSHYTIQVDLGEEMRCGRSLHHLIGDLIK